MHTRRHTEAKTTTLASSSNAQLLLLLLYLHIHTNMADYSLKAAQAAGILGSAFAAGTSAHPSVYLQHLLYVLTSSPQAK